MNIFRIFLLFHISNGLVLKSNRLNILDKNHVKTYAENWIHIWSENPDPLSSLRVNEAMRSIIICEKNKNKENFHCLSLDTHMFFVFVREDENIKSLEIMGLLENPDNIYNAKQIEDLHDELQRLSKDSDCRLDFYPMKKWSHGFYFYEYMSQTIT